MSNDPIQIKINDKALKQALKELEGKLSADEAKNLTKKIAGIMRYAAEQNFEDLGRNKDGTTGTWKPLSAVTIAQRRKKKKESSPILRVSNLMFQSINEEHDEKSAIVGTNKIYATTQHYGAKKGQFGTWKNHPIPWGDIPPRPFLMLTNKDLEEITEAVNDHLTIKK